MANKKIQNAKSKMQNEPAVVKKEAIDQTSEIEKLKTELETKNNAYLRALADYQNLERRFEQELTNSRQAAIARFALELIHVKDDLDKAEEFEKVASLKLIKQKIESLFKKFGIEELDLIGKEYDPNLAECIEVVSDKTRENQILKVYEKGYTLSGRLLKAARVSVSKLKV